MWTSSGCKCKKKKKMEPAEAEALLAECAARAGLPLAAHQLRVATHVLSTARHGAVVAHAMGSGKTRLAAACACVFLAKNPDAKAVFVVRRAVMGQFAHETGTMTNAQPGGLSSRCVFVTFGTFLQRPVDTAGSLLVVDEAHHCTTQIALKPHEWAAVGCDKAFVPKTAGPSGTGKHAAELLFGAARAAKVLLLTGTPVSNGAYELANVLAMAHGYTRPIDATRLAQCLDAAMHGDRSATHVLKGVLSHVFSFHPEGYPETSVRAEGFPHHRMHDIFIPMSAAYARVYAGLERNQIDKSNSRVRTLLNGKESAVNAFYVALRSAANAALVDGECTYDSAKAQWVASLLRQHMSMGRLNCKFVVHSSFKRNGLRIVAGVLEHMGVPWVEVTGDSSSQAIADAVERYNTGRVQVMLLSAAGSEGLHLCETRYLVLMESLWSEARILQVVHRTVRRGSHGDADDTVTVYRLYHIKPSEKKHTAKISAGDPLPTGQPMSIDVYLRYHALKKQKAICALFRFVKSTMPCI